MATIINERDKTLQAAGTRVLGSELPDNLVIDESQLKKISLTANETVFRVDGNGANAPASVTLTATLQNLTGTPTLVVVSGTLGSVPTFSGGTASITYANMTTDAVSVRATLTVGSNTYVSQDITITKVRAKVDTNVPAGLAGFALDSVGLQTITLTWTNPSYTTGGGPGFVNIYAASWPSGPRPTFSSAELIEKVPMPANTYTDVVGTAVRRVYWARNQTKDGFEQSGQAGGTDGIEGTSTKIGTADLGSLVVEAANLASNAVTATKVAAGAIELTKFAAGIEPVSTVSAVPGALTTRTVFNTTDGFLYRWNGSAYVKSVPTTDLTGQLTASQLNVSIGGGNLLSGSSFEIDSNSDGYADTWGNYTGVTTPSLVSDARHGTKAQRVLTVGGVSVPRLNQLSSRPAVDSGATYMLSCWMKAPAGNTLFLSGKVTALSNGGSELWQAPGVTVTATGAWQRLVATVQPANSGFFMATPGLSGTPAAGVELIVDAIQFELGDVATAYAPRPDEILASTITATEIADNAITTPKLIAGAVVAGKIAADAVGTNELAANAVTAAKIAANTITAAQIAANTITATEIAANAITSSELAANSVIAGKIAAGAISATEIAAGAIRTDKLFVTGRGAELNADPNAMDSSAWITVSGTAPQFVTGVTDIPIGGTTALQSQTGTLSYVFTNELLPIDQAKNYRAQVAVKRQAGSGDDTRCGVAWYDAAGTHLQSNVAQPTGAGSPTGWSNGTYSYFGLTGGSAPSSWTVYTISFGPSETAQIPSNAKYMRLGVLMNTGTTAGVQIRATGFRVAEKAAADLIVDGSIIASKIAANAIAVGTAAIQNGAIVNAMIANATITGAKIASATITNANIASATITAAEIANATITATQIANATITGAKIASATITDANIVSATITGAKIAAATITDANISSLNADKITAGSIRGINVNAASFTTSGSYLTSSASGGATTLNVKDTTDFPSSGSGWILDTTNMDDAFSWTGKTATTLTGCTGVLAHNANATVVPLVRGMAIDEASSEQQFYGDRGDGTVERLVRIGTFGSNTPLAVLGSANTSRAILTAENSSGNTIQAVNRNTNIANGEAAVYAESTSDTRPVAMVQLGAARGHFRMNPLAGRPSGDSLGDFAFIYTTGGSTDARTATPRLMYCDGTDWRRVSDDTVFSG